jgi:hypothetical protein
MKLLCNIPEVDNVVRYNSSKYVFRRVDGIPALVCDVEDEDAVRYMLGFPEFSIMDPEAAAVVDETEQQAETKMQADTAAADREAYALMTLDELREEYAQRFGKAAHPATKHETLVEKLLAPRFDGDEE